MRIVRKKEQNMTAESAPADTGGTRYGVPVSDSRGQVVLHPSREQYHDVIEQAKNDGFNMCVDVTAVDFLVHPGRALPTEIIAERFELVVCLISHDKRERIRIRVQIPQEDPQILSIFDLYPGVEAMERETYDLIGIHFEEHPDLTRILMPEDWEGHPLRKDYAQGEIPVQFKFTQAKR